MTDWANVLCTLSSSPTSWSTDTDLGLTQIWSYRQVKKLLKQNYSIYWLKYVFLSFKESQLIQLFDWKHQCNVFGNKTLKLYFPGPTTSRVIYNYYLEKSFLRKFENDSEAKAKYIDDCLKSSNQVQARIKSQMQQTRLVRRRRNKKCTRLP